MVFLFWDRGCFSWLIEITGKGCKYTLWAPCAAPLLPLLECNKRTNSLCFKRNCAAPETVRSKIKCGIVKEAENCPIIQAEILNQWAPEQITWNSSDLERLHVSIFTAHFLYSPGEQPLMNFIHHHYGPVDPCVLDRWRPVGSSVFCNDPMMSHIKVQHKVAPSAFLTPGHVAKAQLHPHAFKTWSEQVNYLTWFLSTDGKSVCYLGHIQLWNFLQSSSDEKWDEGGPACCLRPGTDSRGHGCPVKSNTSTKPASDYLIRHVTTLSHDSSEEEWWKLAVEETLFWSVK